MEVGAVRLHPSGETDVLRATVDPGVPIPAEASAVHGITDGDVAGRPPFPGIAPRLATFLDGCDLAGFGIARFDLPLLDAEFARAGIGFSIADRRVVDALSIFHDRERRDLSAAVEFYTGRPIEDAHSALADAASSLHVLRGQFERYADLPAELDELDRLASPGRRDPSWIDPQGRLVRRDGEILIRLGIIYASAQRRPARSRLAAPPGTPSGDRPWCCCSARTGVGGCRCGRCRPSPAG